MCEGKKPYDTKQEADDIASRLGVDTHSYACPYCKKWHTGHLKRLD